MSALTLRLPDDRHQRLRAMAEARGVTLNRLIDQADDHRDARRVRRRDTLPCTRAARRGAAGGVSRGLEPLAVAAQPRR